jgi:RNA polymerase-interacting CarD/CdnL/TRCF family regulator
MTKLSTGRKFKVGDKIVRYSRIWRISKIEENEQTLFYEPLFPTNKNNNLSLSIPINQTDTVGIRWPISKADANSLLNRLSQKIEIKKPIDLVEIKEKLEQGVFATTVETLTNLWWTKKADIDAFTKSQEEVLELAIKTLTEEIAFVFQLSPLGARKKITNNFLA